VVGLRLEGSLFVSSFVLKVIFFVFFYIQDSVDQLESVRESDVTAKRRSGVEVLRQSRISLQLRQENNRLQQAVGVLTQAHARLSEDLSQKNNDIFYLETDRDGLKLQVTELLEKVKLTELELAKCKKDSSQLSAECVGLRDRISVADSDAAKLHHELDSHANSLQQKQLTVDSLQGLLSTECKKTVSLAEQLAEEQNKLMSQQNSLIAASVQNSDLTAQNSDLQHKLEVAQKECSSLQLSLNEFREIADNADGELQRQMQCLQNDYQLMLQSLHSSEEKCEVLRLQCDHLTTENASCKLQVLEESKKRAEMQEKIDKLEQTLQDNVKALTESERIADECVNERAVVQRKLTDAETERNCLQTELSDCTARYQNIEKSLLEVQERLMRSDQLDLVRQQTAHFREILENLQQQLKEEELAKMERKHRMGKMKIEVANLQEKITTQNGTVADVLRAKEESDRQTASLQLKAEHLACEKVSLEQQIRMLEDSNSSLQKDLLTVTDSCENTKKLNAELQLRVDEVCTLEQNLSDQVNSLRSSCEQKDEMIRQLNLEKEEMNRSLAVLSQKTGDDAAEISSLKLLSEQKDETIQQLNSEKEMISHSLAVLTRKADADAVEISSLRLSCEHEGEVIRQLNSEKEDMSHSLSVLTQKTDADAVEITAHVRRISELQEQNTIVEDKMERVSAEKQVLVDELSTCKDIIEQQKQSVADAKHGYEHCQKVISDFEEKSRHWRDEKLILEGRIIELEKYVTSKENEVQAMQERQEVERTSIDCLPLEKSSESMEASNKDKNDTDEHRVFPTRELVENMDAVGQKCEVEKNVHSVHNPHPERDNGSLRECQSLLIHLQDTCEQSKTEKHMDTCMMLKVDQVSSSENDLESGSQVQLDRVCSNQNSSSETEVVNLQEVMSENAVMQQNKHLEPAKRALVRVDTSIVSAENDQNVARHSASVGCYKQCQLNAATGSESSLAVSGSCESAICDGCVKDCSASKQPLNVETVAHSNDTVMKTTRDANMAVVNTVDKQEYLGSECGGQRKHRKIIKRFTRLPQSSAVSTRNSKPLSFGSSDLPKVHMRAASSVEVNVPCVADVVEQLPNGRTSLSIEASSSSVTEITSAVKLQDNAGNSPAPVPDVGVASGETNSSVASSVDVCSVAEAASSEQQLSSPQALSQHSQYSKDNRNSWLNTEPEYHATRNVCASVDNHSDNQPDLALRLTCKRLSTDVNGGDAKKLQLG